MRFLNVTIVLVALVITLVKMISNLSGLKLTWPNETIANLVTILIWVSIIISSIHFAMILL